MKKHLPSILSIFILSLCAAWAVDPTVGRLICATGAPLANCAVRVEFRDSNGVVSSAGTTTDANGRFSVTLQCTNSSGGNRHFYVTSPCCGHPWIIPSDKCSGDLGDLICQECDTRACLPPPANMVDWWTFDEPPIGPAAPVANDIAGAVNNKGLHINGPAPIAAGKVRGALCFDGVDDWVQVRDHAEVNFFGSCVLGNGAEDLTIDAWVRIDANALDSRMPIVDKRVRPQNQVGYFLYIANGHLAFQMSDGVSIGNYVEPGVSITPGPWHLVAVTVDRCNGVGTLYVDGAPVLVFEPLRGNIANDSDLFIGRISPPFGDVFLRGCLDELEFFKRALKPEEIADLYAADSRGKCRPCVALRCPEDIRLVSCEDKTPVDYEVTLINLCNSNITVKCEPPSGSSFPLGISPVVCEATDPAGNVIDRCGFTVTIVRDTTPPEIHCPSNQVYWVCSPNGGVINYTVTATDDYDTNVTIVCVPPSGSSFPPGVHTVHCQAFDDCQNTARCEFTVTVRVDSEPPKIECPPDIRRITCDSNAVVVTYTVTATDDSGSVAVVCNPPSGSAFPVGTTTVLCRAVDRCDRESRCEFKVTVVRDTIPPEIHCPSNFIHWVCSPNGGVVNYTVTATDNYDTNVTIVCVPPSGSSFPPGVHLVQCQAFDDCQNSARCEFTVTVRVDSEPPKIECPPDIRRITCDSNAVVVTYTVTATDDSGSVTIICVPPSGSAFPVGTTTVLCRALDRCDRESRCEFRVSIIPDLQPPQITCPSNITVVTTCTNVAQLNYTVTATDNFDTNVTIVCVPPSGSIFPAGVTAVTCTAADDCGNRSQCSFQVRVRHVEPPALIIRRLAGGRIAVCWPVTAPGFQLQVADHISTPIPWIDVPGAPVIVGGEYCVIFDPNQRHRFYRLRCAGVVRVDDE